MGQHAHPRRPRLSRRQPRREGIHDQRAGPEGLLAPARAPPTRLYSASDARNRRRSSSASTPVRRALVSVHDKTGVAEFARALAASGVPLVSTGGTAAHLKESGVDGLARRGADRLPRDPGRPRQDAPPEGLRRRPRGRFPRRPRPRPGAGRRSRPSTSSSSTSIRSRRPSRPARTRAEIVEMIDVGGPAMIRAAAKNHTRVAVVVGPRRLRARARGDPRDRRDLPRDPRAAGRPGLRAHRGLRRRDRRLLRRRRPSRAAEFPEHLVFAFDRVGALRYGENPHQRAALYAFRSAPPDALVRFQMLQGKELSFNNLLDLDSAVALARDFDGPAAVIVKHNNPCGVGRRRHDLRGVRPRVRLRPARGLRRHHRDPRQGGRRPGVARPPALRRSRRRRRVHRRGARRSSRKKPNIRLLRVPVSRRPTGGLDWKRIEGGLLLQDSDSEPDQSSGLEARCRSASRPRSSARRASSPGKSRGASSRTRSSSPTRGRRSASAPAR